MGTKDERVDQYIDKSKDFARPILEHLRALVHANCPDVEETLKWSFPHFQYKGMLCHMAAFKEHCAFGFWKGSLVVGDDSTSEKAMGQFGRITKLSDLPSKKVIAGLIKKAMKLNEDGVKAPTRSKPKEPRALDVPAELTRALERNEAARKTFESFTPGRKREYVEWITEAKTAATRERRIETAIEWIAEGKPRNWKYMNC